MSFEFVDLDPKDYMEASSAVVSGVPFTMACWFRSDDADVNQTLMCVADNNVSNDYFTLEASGSGAGDPVSVIARTVGAKVGSTSTGYTVNTWHHAAARFIAVNDRKVYIDGGSEGSNTTSVTPANLNVTAIGRVSDSSPSLYMSGRIAEAAIWKVALTVAEIRFLARGNSPLLLTHRLKNIKLYRSFRGNINATGELPILKVFNGPTVKAHPPIIYPLDPFVITAPVVVGGATHPGWMSDSGWF